jgi:hypothetical protein
MEIHQGILSIELCWTWKVMMEDPNQWWQLAVDRSGRDTTPFYSNLNCRDSVISSCAFNMLKIY